MKLPALAAGIFDSTYAQDAYARAPGKTPSSTTTHSADAGASATSDPTSRENGTISTVPIHTATVITWIGEYRASSGFWVMKNRLNATAASRISSAPGSNATSLPSPKKISSAPTKLSSMPAKAIRVTCSPSSVTAKIAVKIGAVLTRNAADPAWMNWVP